MSWLGCGRLRQSDVCFWHLLGERVREILGPNICAALYMAGVSVDAFHPYLRYTYLLCLRPNFIRR